MISLPPSDFQSLRARLEERLPATSKFKHTRYVSTGINGFDCLLGGGIIQGGVNAWVGRPVAGALSILRATVSHSLRHGRRVAVVDGTARFVASDWLELPNSLNLWMVRLRDVARAFKVAEILSRCGAFELVVVDVGMSREPNRIHRAHLRRASKDGASALLLTGDKVGLLGARVVRIDSLDLNLRTLERTLRLSLVKGGAPRSLEVILDVSGQFIPCRMPSYSALPDRRSRAKRAAS